VISRAWVATLVLAAIATALPRAPTSDPAADAADDGNAIGLPAQMTRWTDPTGRIAPVNVRRETEFVASPDQARRTLPVRRAVVTRERKRGATPLPPCSDTQTAMRGTRSLCRGRSGIRGHL
jgi:hypothetical protein